LGHVLKFIKSWNTFVSCVNGTSEVFN